VNVKKIQAFGLLSILMILCFSACVYVPEARPVKLYIDGEKPHQRKLFYDNFAISIKADIERGRHLNFHFAIDSDMPLKFNQNKLIVLHNNRRVFSRNNKYEIKTLDEPRTLDIFHSVEVYNPKKDPGYSSNYFHFERGDILILMGEDVIECDGEYYDIQALLFSFKE